jgi:sucrose-6-phosphate hydrolase SacC (GH32 family)
MAIPQSGSMARTSFALKKDEDFILSVFIDRNLVEIFASNRQARGHRHIQESPNIRLSAKDGDASIRSIKAWKMQTICQTP